MADPKGDPVPPLELPEVTFPPKPPEPRTWAHYIPGDYQGLYNLARQLYWFAWRCNDETVQLTTQVNKITGSWTGVAVAAFQASYTKDAKIIAGYIRVVMAMARVLDTLAARLAKLERTLEMEFETLSREGLIKEQGIGLYGPNFVPVPGRADSARIAARVFRHRNVLAERADQYRKEAAAELAVLFQALYKGIDHYLVKDAEGYDPMGLLPEDKRRAYAGLREELNSKFKAQEAVLRNAGIDWDKVADDLMKGSGAANDIGEVITHVKGVKNAKDLSTKLSEGAQVAEIMGGLILLFIKKTPK